MTNGATQNGGDRDHTTASAPTEDDAKNLWNRYEYTRFGDNMKNELIEVRSDLPRASKLYSRFLTHGRTIGHHHSL
jgi:hypothetical protein